MPSSHAATQAMNASFSSIVQSERFSTTRSTPSLSVQTEPTWSRARVTAPCASGTRALAPRSRFCAATRTRSLPSPSARMDGASSRPAATGRSGSGTRSGSKRSPNSTATRRTSTAWPSAPTAWRWPRAAETAPFGCGERARTAGSDARRGSGRSGARRGHGSFGEATGRKPVRQTQTDPFRPRRQLLPPTVRRG